MHPMLKAGITAALLALSTPAQQSQPDRQPAPRGQHERPRPPQPGRSDAAEGRNARAGDRQGGATTQGTGAAEAPPRGGQPGGETRPAGAQELTTEQREKLARQFLEKHPELAQQLRERADADGDGKLSDAERAQMKQLVEARLKESHQQAEQRSEERREERGEQRRDERRDDRRERADTNDDGRVGPRERQRAQERRDGAGPETRSRQQGDTARPAGSGSGERPARETPRSQAPARGRGGH